MTLVVMTAMEHFRFILFSLATLTIIFICFISTMRFYKRSYFVTCFGIKGFSVVIIFVWPPGGPKSTLWDQTIFIEFPKSHYASILSKKIKISP